MDQELQKQWDEGGKGHLYTIKQKVKTGRNTRLQNIISRMRLGHTGLNKTMYLLKKASVIFSQKKILKEEVKKYGVSLLDI